MKMLHIISGIILLIAGLNYGLEGLFNFDIFSFIFGDFTILTRIVYVIVGLAAIYRIVRLKNPCVCKGKHK